MTLTVQQAETLLWAANNWQRIAEGLLTTSAMRADPAHVVERRVGSFNRATTAVTIATALLAQAREAQEKDAPHE